LRVLRGCHVLRRGRVLRLLSQDRRDVEGDDEAK
jgi:hypothetical protein